jgi:hypothetical protein
MYKKKQASLLNVGKLGLTLLRQGAMAALWGPDYCFLKLSYSSRPVIS